MNKIKFVENTHKYYLNNREIPSVTTIMQFITDCKYGTIPESVLENAREKGKKVHFAIEVYNKTNYLGLDEENRGYVEAYIKWLKDFKIDKAKLQSEVKTYNNALNYAGTVDLIYDKQTVIDIKTTAELDIKNVAVQTTAYKNALNNFKDLGYNIKECYVLRLKKNGTYEYIKLQDKFNIFLACLTLYNFVGKE